MKNGSGKSLKMKNQCNKKIFVKIFGRKLSCIRPKGHRGGRHTVNLSGLTIGKSKIIRLAKFEIYNGCKYTRWIIRQGNIERNVRASYLINGASSGRRPKDEYYGLSITPEYAAVTNHFRAITKPNSNQKTYYRMRFYNEWNPYKNGDYRKGAKWIIDNLGKKPGKNWSLDIINHEKGFVPNNLRWALRKVQRLNQQHRILGTISEKEFAIEAKRRGYVRKNVRC